MLPSPVVIRNERSVQAMVNLHYANLPDVNTTSLSLMRQINFGIGDYQQYVKMAMDMMWAPERLEKVRWTDAPADLLASGNHQTPGRPGDRASPIWVLIEEIQASEGVEAVDDFCGAKYVIEAPASWATKITILDSDFNLGLLLLERRPTDSAGILYLPPDAYVLSRQLRALTHLRDRPDAEHRGLLRLLEDTKKVEWPDPEPVSNLKWEFLVDESVEGTDEQRRFVSVALDTPDFALLEGPPGSGKTTSICELIVQNIRRGRRVMLCASTHVAVDNVLESLQRHGITEKEVVAVRIGDERKLSDDVKEFQLQNRAKKERKDLIERLSSIRSPTEAQQYLLDALRSSDESEESVVSRLILESANLVCGTTIGILQHPDIKARNVKRGKPSLGSQNSREAESEKVVRPFDCLILDEASKTTFQEFLVPGLYSRRWVLVGDVKQLSPYVETTHVEDNLKTMLKSASDARVCLDVFHAWEGVNRHTTQGLLVVGSPYRDLYVNQVDALGLTLLDLESGQQPYVLDVIGAQVILAGKKTLKEFERLISPDFVTSPPDAASPSLTRRHEHWLQHNKWGSEGDNDGESLSLWANELSWRLARSFEVRQDEPSVKRYDEEMNALVPQWYDEQERAEFMFRLDKLKRIALPSVLELIQRGFGRRDGSWTGSSLTDGMNQTAYSQRHVLLSYQHRMHPDISKAPRNLFYESQSLKDPASMARNRDWTYSRYKERAGWVQTVGGKADARNANAVEVRIVMDELEAFLEWAADHHKPESSGGGSWEVAVLTFYKGQESALRRNLQKKLRTPARSQFAMPDGSAEIRLCTVDRFQGHEADLVILSFVRGEHIGFLDSPNRLNVAITRARYQLVMVGSHRTFAGQPRETRLKALAETTPTLRTAWEKRP